MTQLPIYNKVSELSQKDPNARWVVFGDFTYANLFKAAGAAVLNGTTLVPDPAMNQALDGSGINRRLLLDSPNLQLQATSAPVPRFAPRQPGAFPGVAVASVNPCSVSLDALQVHYVGFVILTAEPWMKCLEPVATENGISIYKRHY
jgi:hypothetical protein